MGRLIKPKVRLDRQRIYMAELLALDQQELELLKTKSAATLQSIRVIKRVFEGARVVEVKE